METVQYILHQTIHGDSPVHLSANRVCVCFGLGVILISIDSSKKNCCSVACREPHMYESNK